MRNNFIWSTLSVVVIMLCPIVFAANNSHPLIQDKETSLLNAFFKNFIEVYNAKDIEKIKVMSGEASEMFLRWASGPEKIVGMEIVNLSIASSTNVTVKVTMNKGNDKHYSARAIFAMNKTNGKYSIQNMTLPESDSRNREVVNALAVAKRLSRTICKRDLNDVKRDTTFGDHADFESELKNRGLLWIKDSIENGDDVAESEVSVHRAKDDSIIGCLKIRRKGDSTVALRQCVIKDGKIDADVNHGLVKGNMHE